MERGGSDRLDSVVSRLDKQKNMESLRYFFGKLVSRSAAKPLFGTSAFWGAMLIPTIVAVCVALPIWRDEGYAFSLPSSSVVQSYAEFLLDFRLPLLILALVFPLVALASANHRSDQTAENLEAQRGQNIFANYYKHLEEFERHAYSGVSDDAKQKMAINQLVNVRGLHRTTYPDAQHEAPRVAPSLKRALEENAQNVNDALRVLRRSNVNLDRGNLAQTAERLVEECLEAVTKIDATMFSIFLLSGRAPDLRGDTLGANLKLTRRKAQHIKQMVEFDTGQDAMDCSAHLFVIFERLKAIEEFLKPIHGIGYSGLAERAGLPLFE